MTGPGPPTVPKPPRAITPVGQLAVLAVGVAVIAAVVPSDQRAAVLTLWLGLTSTVGATSAVYRQVAHVRDAVGPTNGENVQEGIQAVRDFQSYQSRHNHQVRNLLQAQNMMLRELLREMGVEVPEPPPDPDSQN